MLRIRREELPACALFLLMYAFGISCGLACYDGGYSVQILPAFSAAFAGGAWQQTLVRALLYCLCAALTQAALVLLTGFSVWLLPLWAVGVLLRSISVGLCAALCIDAVRTAIPSADLLAACIGAAFAAAFVSEVRLGMLPLVRRTEPNVEDAQYLAVGLRYALRFLLLSVFLTAVALLLLRHLLAG